MRAAIYTRISHDPEHDHLGVSRQEEDCRRLCERRGWDILEPVYEDDDVSAFSGRLRHDYERLCTDIRLGKVNVVVAWHPDRLHRSIREHLDFIELCAAAQVTIVTVRGGEVDPVSPYARMQAGILAMVAEAESAHKRERIRRQQQQLAESGASHNGTRAFGYRTGSLELDPDEAAVIQDMVRRCLNGESLRGICQALNSQRIPTVGGTQFWRPEVVKRILRSARIAGLREHHGEVVATGQWPAIISAEEHRRLRAILDDPRRKERRAVRRYELTGLVRCANPGCGVRMVSRPASWENGKAGGRSRTYVCSKDHPEKLPDGSLKVACGRMRVVAESVEKLAAEAVFDALEMPTLREKLRRRHDPAGIRLKRQEIERKLVELAEDEAAGVITRSEWKAKKAVLDRRLSGVQSTEAAQAKDAVLEPYLWGDRSLRDDWAGLNLDQRRAVFQSVLKAVWVKQPEVNGGPFRSERVYCERAV